MYSKLKIYSKTKLNDCKILWKFAYTLNMRWLYHFNYKWQVPFIWFYKSPLNEIFMSNNYKCVKIKKIIEILFHLKGKKNCVGGFASKIQTMFSLKL